MNGIQNIIEVVYILAAVLFILGLKQLSSPATARSGNRVAAIGMVLAIVATLLSGRLGNFLLIGVALVIGAVIATYLARTVQMTAVPQMVALLNGMGGGAAALVAIVEFIHALNEGVPAVAAVSMVFGLAIGGVAFAGSMIAFGKLQGLISTGRIVLPAQEIFNGLLLLIVAGLAVYGIATGNALLFGAAFFVAMILGVVLVMPIGGADMPVVISLLNSLTGLAVAATGFVLSNNLLIIGGTLVGASGALLTQLMGKAMNRSLGNVLFGAFGAVTGAPIGGGAPGMTGTVKEISLEDAAVLLGYARNVIVVPGYGMAVAQAQHEVRELADTLEKRGVTVKYAIHPVAGRMPGHMNVLLAEANVPYDHLFDMEEINPEFERADVALVIGANDVTNPAARHSPGSPIYGMPILDVDKAKNVIVIKRSMKPGFAGIDNELYLDPKTSMLFGDAKDAVTRLRNEIKAV